MDAREELSGGEEGRDGRQRREARARWRGWGGMISALLRSLPQRKKSRRRRRMAGGNCLTEIRLAIPARWLVRRSGGGGGGSGEEAEAWGEKSRRKPILLLMGSPPEPIFVQFLFSHPLDRNSWKFSFLPLPKIVRGTARTSRENSVRDRSHQSKLFLRGTGLTSPGNLPRDCVP